MCKSQMSKKRNTVETLVRMMRSTVVRMNWIYEDKVKAKYTAVISRTKSHVARSFLKVTKTNSHKLATLIEKV